MRARGVGGLLGADGEPLDGRDGIGGERARPSGRWPRRRRRSCAARQAPDAARPRGARLVGALMLVLDGALERRQLGVRVRQVAGEHTLLLDALAGQRLELRAHALELGAKAFLLLGLGAGLGELGRQALVALGYLAQLLVALGRGL